MKPKILLLEDNPLLQMVYRNLLGTAYDVKAVASVAEGKSAVSTEEFDAVVSDFQLADGNCTEVFAHYQPTHLVLMSGEIGGREFSDLVARTGAAVFPKPFASKALLSHLQSAIQLEAA